jgi:hypothetical protein
MRDQRRRCDRERLGRPRHVARDRALRHGALLDRKNRLAGLAIEGEQQPHLGRDDHRGHAAAVLLELDQHRLR